MLQVRSASPDVSVWFHAFGPPDNVTLSVDAAGVNASIVSPDLAASNGILYVIDHVLGIPYQNVFKKLSTDPMMKITYDLGTQRNFNEQMEDDKKKFTFFVPSNEAWEKQQSKNPSAMKKIMMGAFPGNTKMILERHLMANEAMELEEMVKQGKVQMARGGTIQVTKDNGAKNRNKVAPQANNKGKPESGTRYLVEWDGIVAEVERGDIECTNGYIHVIRDVLMKDKDVQVNTAAVPVGATSGFLSFTLLSFLAAKLLSL
ncbi:unnamed protein product [Notodromas monacha]|uniref:FAS1 domain-containing protein n=1 Tax=Notodromas monacha TaxID=399045 RepID=A0A7R9BYX7_9CRUS|nr:unnamed protein product [Notodromas monacha]CAG0924362.1 unnamed protein product [Notodromas monacha]